MLFNLLILIVLEGFPSGQRDQTVNLTALPSEVRILLPPLLIKSKGCRNYCYTCIDAKVYLKCILSLQGCISLLMIQG